MNLNLICLKLKISIETIGQNHFSIYEENKVERFNKTYEKETYRCSWYFFFFVLELDYGIILVYTTIKITMRI